MKATNRQKKVLTLFDIPFSEDISAGAAGWEIGNLFFDEANRKLWSRYLYLTKDFGSDSAELADYKPEELAAVIIPEGWSEEKEQEEFNADLVTQTMTDGSPFDDPAPAVDPDGKSFMFTGKLALGTRKECESAVASAGGNAAKTKTVTPDLDFLVIGSGGSKSWKRGSYGSKIEKAILCRRMHGAPAIISEEHFSAALNQQ